MRNKKEKSKQRKRRSILLAILMIVFTGIVLTTSTYAWFTANKTVSVSSIDVTVATSNGLQISTDAINWKTIIANSDITGVKTSTYPTAVNQLPTGAETLSPISSALEIDASTGFLKMFAGTIESNNTGAQILTAEQSTEVNGTSGKFVAFDLFFQVNDTTPIYLSNGSNVVVKEGQQDTGIQNAARIAFVIQGNKEVGTDPSTIQGLKADSSANTILWEPNYDVHTAAGVQNAASPYGITTTQTNGELLEYYGVKADISTENNVELNSKSETYFKKMTPTIKTKKEGIPTNAYESVFTLQKGVTKIRVYMWVEGQDVDCENTASGGSLQYNLQFTSNASQG